MFNIQNNHLRRQTNQKRQKYIDTLNIQNHHLRRQTHKKRQISTI